MRYTKSENPYRVGRFPTGSTVNITIYDLLDNAVIVNAAAMTEIGTTGYFKYLFDPSPSITTDYFYIMSDTKEEFAGIFTLGGWPDTVSSDQAFLKKTVKNKRVLTKIANSWYLIIYDDDGVTELINKKLTDKNDADIIDIATGILAQEATSSV